MKERPGLRSGSLTFLEVLATSVALIGLSMTPVLIAPYMYANAGNGAWLAYVFGGVMLLFVAININQFARRSSAAGSMYAYAASHLGPVAGALAGWCLIWCYVFVGASQFGSMTLFLQNLFGTAGIQVPALLVFAIFAIVWWYFAYRDIALSTMLMLALESLSVAIICVLVAIVLVAHGWHVDTQQLHLKGVESTGVGLGIATAIFSLVGFESATAFGEEARKPLATIPRAVIGSVVIASMFFIVAIYAEIVGLRDSSMPLDRLSAPLWTLADALRVSYLKVPIAIGAIFSSFSVALACVTTGGRVVFAMARQGLFPQSASAVGRRYATPHVAVTGVIIAMLLIALVMYGLHTAPIDIFNFSGTLSSCGFIVIYAMIVIAAPRYLKRIGELGSTAVAFAVVALLFLIVPAVTLFYPTPPPPTSFFPYLFLAYMLAGWAWFGLIRKPAAQQTEKPELRPETELAAENPPS
ncbi:MAG: APC family permease [Vulcanimicrobiaceae bacterium]